MNATQELSKVNGINGLQNSEAGQSLQAQFPTDHDAMAAALVKTNKNLARIAPSKHLSGKRNSNFSWLAFVLTHKSDTMNIKQVGSELEGRQAALITNLYKFKEQKNENDRFRALAIEHKAHAKSLRKKAMKDLDEAEYLEAQADTFDTEAVIAADKAKESEELSVMAYAPVMACLKDIDLLTSAYTALEEKIRSENNGRMDEEIFEEEQELSYIKELLTQSMQDIRECGAIRKGAQRAIENIGIDPGWIQHELMSLLKHLKSYYGTEEACYTTEGVEGCGEKIVQKILGSHDLKLKRLKLEAIKVKTMMFIEESNDNRV